MVNQIQFFITAFSREKRTAALKNNRGAAMIYLIGVIMLMSVLGAAMLNLTSTATLSHVASNHMDRAYFIAEAGCNYALGFVKDDIESDGQYDDIYALHNQTFILDTSDNKEEGRFKIAVDDSDINFTLITSTGSIDAEVSTTVETKLIYQITRTSSQALFDRSLFSGQKIV